MTLLAANRAPSALIRADMLCWNPPPGIHTITGRFSPTACAAVQTFAVKQSSLSDALGPLGVDKQLGPNFVASSAPLHGITGFDGRQRKSRTCGAANGMPLKASTPSVSLAVPWTVPLDKVTSAVIAAAD